MPNRPEILLHPNVPKPLHGLNPRTLLGQEWWDAARQKAYAASNYCCSACGIAKQAAPYHNWLEAHEMYQYDYQKKTATMTEIVALCHACHNFIHSGRMYHELVAGKMPPEKFFAILKHGFLLIKQNQLSPNIHALTAGTEAVKVLTLCRRKNEIPTWAYAIASEYEKVLLQKIAADDPMITAELDWGAWRLILDGHTYPPLYKNQEEWAAAYQNSK